MEPAACDGLRGGLEHWLCCGDECGRTRQKIASLPDRKRTDVSAKIQSGERTPLALERAERGGKGAWGGQ